MQGGFFIIFSLPYDSYISLKEILIFKNKGIFSAKRIYLNTIKQFDFEIIFRNLFEAIPCLKI